MEQSSTDRIFEILFNEDEITWQSIIYELVRSEEMDPWDINISTLSMKFIDTLKKLQSFDVRISGKVVLAAAILLNIKSTRLLDEESRLDDIMNPPQDILEDDEEGLGYNRMAIRDIPADKITLIPRTPQPRKRKISVFDLVEALQKALEVKRRRVLRDVEVDIPVIERGVDITKLILDVYSKIKKLLSEKDNLTFFELSGSDRKQDQVATLVPLLHLTNQGKIDINQENHFDDIDITIIKNEVKNE